VDTGDYNDIYQAVTSSQHVYEVRPRKDKRGVDLISDALPFGGLWYGEPDAISNAIGCAKFYSRSHDAVIRLCDGADDVIEMQNHSRPTRAGGVRSDAARSGVTTQSFSRQTGMTSTSCL
jgi:hypothetical protein